MHSGSDIKRYPSRTERSRTVVIVEDDPKVASFLEYGLEEEGYSVEVCKDGRSALQRIDESPPDLVLLDIRLPDISGVEVCMSVRRRFPSMPILMLTALDDVADRVRGLEAGADDYLAKPFSFDELLARMRSVMRRAHLLPHVRVLEVGPLRMDVESRVCEYDNSPIELSRTEFDLLAYLVARQGQAVYRDEALTAVWGASTEVAPNTVDVYVGYLRRKLCGFRHGPAIESVRGIGYRVVPVSLSSKPD